jgi:hypothetical protein
VVAVQRLVVASTVAVAAAVVAQAQVLSVAD